MHTKDIADRLEWPKRPKTTLSCLISEVNPINSCGDLTPFESGRSEKSFSVPDDG